MATETAKRKPPADVVFDSPPCPACTRGPRSTTQGGLSCDSSSWWCETCGCSWDIDGTNGEWPDAEEARLP